VPAGASGSDSFGNTWPQGLFGQQLTLDNQASSPPAFSGASVFYSSSGGRPKYLAQSGADLVLERSSVSLSHLSMTTQTLPTSMSATLSYLANEAQAGSEYEIEIDGIITAPTSGTGLPAYNFAVGVDGSTLGGAVGLGAVFIQLGNTYTFTLRGRITIGTTGAGGTAAVATDGAATQQGANVGNTQVSWGFASNSGGATKSFDTTTNHSINIVGAWGSTTATGHKADTYRSRLSRRN